MEVTATSRIEKTLLYCDVAVSETNENTEYGYYLCERKQGVLQKQMYTRENSCKFQLLFPGAYYVKVFVRSWPDGMQGEHTTTIKDSNIIRYYLTKSISYEELDAENFQSIEGVIYDILWDDVHFEFFIHYKPDSGRAVILGNGGLRRTAKNTTPMPVFHRISWAKEIPCTAIYYFDPTCYLGDLSAGYGYGTNDRWYLKQIAVLIERILNKP